MNLGINKTDIGNYKWNERYKYCLQEKGVLKYELLAHLGNDFVGSATKYGKIIISELYLPYNQKTIKPINAGGDRNKKIKI